MIWLTSPDLTAATLPAAWLVATDVRPGNLTERSLLRREMARRIVARQLRLSEDDVQIDHDPQGRPLLARPAGRQLHLSLATRCGLVAVALAPKPVGVDVEHVGHVSALPLAALHPDERTLLRGVPDATRALAFARLWSAKEAYVKALGTGFARAPESFRATLLPEDRFVIDDPLLGSRTQGASRTIENGGQDILAAAMVVLD